MAFERGHPRYGGRRKGSPHKKAQVYERAQLLALIDATQAAHPEQTCNPFEWLLALMMDETADTGHRLTAAITLGDRLLPKLKALELELGAQTQQILLHRYGAAWPPARNGHPGPPATQAPERKVYED